MASERYGFCRRNAAVYDVCKTYLNWMRLVRNVVNTIYQVIREMKVSFIRALN